MLTITNGLFSPITLSAGFLRQPLDDVRDALETWHRELRTVVTSRPAGRFPESLRQLEPLVSGSIPRELLVIHGEWTAYFNNSLRGTDAVTAISVLSRRLNCAGVEIISDPGSTSRHVGGSGSARAVQFELFGPLDTDFLNCVRTISVVEESGGWHFTASGTVQDFEDTSAYSKRLVRDRFTSEMLEKYCQALEIDPFTDAAYGDSVVISSNPRGAPGQLVMNLLEARRFLGIDETESG
jgi:hypothetical protein